jgi:hypothetical protein
MPKGSSVTLHICETYNLSQANYDPVATTLTFVRVISDPEGMRRVAHDPDESYGLCHRVIFTTSLKSAGRHTRVYLQLILSGVTIDHGDAGITHKLRSLQHF